MDIGRRRALGAAAGAAWLAPWPGPAGRAGAAPHDVEAVVAAFAAAGGAGEGRRFDDDDGALELDLPELAENGFSVPLTVRVASPMTPDDHVEAIAILAPGNPHVLVATFRFAPASGAASVETRIRLARDQRVTAVARTSTDVLHRASVDVRVTIGGCGA